MKKASKYVVKTVSAVLAIILLLGAMPMGALAAEMDADQVAIFPAGEMNITQLAYEGYSHGQQNAIDFVPNGRVVAPFDATIAYVDANWGYVTLQSKEELKLPDGTLDYLTVGFMHDSDISDLYVGMELTQGQPFYDAGGMGDGNPWAYGSHVHMTVHRGHVKRGYPYGTGNMYAFDAMYIDPTFTTSYAGRGKGYAVSGMNNVAPSDYSTYWRYLFEYCSSRNVNFMVTATKQVNLRNVPGIESTYDVSYVTRSVSAGTMLHIVEVVENKVGNQHYWYKTSDGDFVWWKDTDLHWYTALCEITPINTTKIKITKSKTPLWNIPCSDATCADAYQVKTLKKGAELKIVGEVINSKGNLWLVTSDGRYVFSGNTNYAG